MLGSGSEPTDVPQPPERRSGLADIPRMRWPEDEMPRPGLTRRWLPPVVALLLFTSVALLYLLPAVLVLIGGVLLWKSPLWTTKERIVGTVVPVIALGAFLPLLALLSTPREGQVVLPRAPTMAVLLLALVGIGALIWIVARGIRAARQVDAAHADAKS